MSTIKITNDKDEYKEYSYLDHYKIEYTFEKQSAEVNIAILKDNLIYVNSQTDGYHWLQFWLAQNPFGKKLVEMDHTEERILVKALFLSYGWVYEPEDKETCFLTLEKPVEYTDIELLANIISDRFALREKNFE